MPAISVLLPVRNGSRFVSAAIDSVLGQTFGDLELIVIDDASVDDTPAILNGYRDPRVLTIRNQMPVGLSGSVNAGLERARGQFIARMDADDIAMSHRLERQAHFLAMHPDVGILGSACLQIGESDEVLRTVVMPDSDLEIRWRSLTANPFLHPTVMLRRSVLDMAALRYDETLATAQDYDLWVRLLRHTRGANLVEPLVALRIHRDSTSTTMAADQSRTHARIAIREIADLWPDHPFEPNSFAMLRRLLAKMRPLPTADDRHRYQLISGYTELLQRFGARHGGSADWLALRRSETVAAAFLVLLPPWHRGFRDAARRLADIEPNLSSAFLNWAFHATRRRLKQQFLGRARRRAA